MHDLKPYLEVMIGGSLMGLIPIMLRFSFNLNVYSVAFFRMLFATLIVALVFLISRRLPESPKKNLKWIIGVSGSTSLAVVCYFYAVSTIQVASAVLLLKTLAIWMIVFALCIEKIQKSTLLSLVMGFLGLLLIVKGSLQFDLLGFIAGSFAGLFAAIALTIISYKLKDSDVFSFLLYANAYCSIFLAPLLLIHLPSIPIIEQNSLILFGLALLGTVIPYWLITDGSTKISGQYVGLLQNSEMILPILLAFLFFKEVPSWFTILGGVLICISYLPIFLEAKNES